MNTVQFDPKIATDLQIDWRRHATDQGADPFADLLADRLKHRAESEQSDSDARRRHTVSEPVSGRRPRVALAHARTLRGEAKEVDGTADRRLADRTEHASGKGCANAAKDNPAPDDDSDTAAEDETAETRTSAEAAIATDQPVQAASDQAQPTDATATTIVATQPAAEDTASGTAEMLVGAPAMPTSLPVPACGQNATPGQTADAENTVPDGSQANADASPEQQATAAMAEAELSAAVAALTTGTTPAEGKSMPSVAPVQPTALPSAPAAEQPLAQIAEAIVPVAADLAPQPAQPKSARPAIDIKPRPGTPARASAGMPDPVPGPTPASQPLQPHQTTVLQPGGSGEFGGAGDMLEQSFSDDGSGQGWALHLAQGAAGKRADFVAQLRQHLQNLPAHEQVAVHIQRALREGTGKFSIQLSPAELGGIHVKLEIDEDKRVTAAVTVERPSTLELLQRDVKGLERALHNAGLNMEGGDLSFSLGHSGDQDFAQDRAQSAASATPGTVLDGQSDGEQPDGAAAQVMDTAAGVVNLQV